LCGAEKFFQKSRNPFFKFAKAGRKKDDGESAASHAMPREIIIKSSHGFSKLHIDIDIDIDIEIAHFPEPSVQNRTPVSLPRRRRRAVTMHT
jgi:hypothetical protein